MQQDDTPLWLTLEEYAAHMKCSRQTASRLCAKKKIPCQDIGTGHHRIWRIHKSALSSSYADATRGASASPPTRRRAVVVPKLV